MLLVQALACAACTLVKQSPPFTIADDLKPGQAKAMDIRTSKVPWGRSHPPVVLKDPAGGVHVVIEDASEPGLSALEDPANTAFQHFTWGP